MRIIVIVKEVLKNILRRGKILDLNVPAEIDVTLKQQKLLVLLVVLNVKFLLDQNQTNLFFVMIVLKKKEEVVLDLQAKILM